MDLFSRPDVRELRDAFRARRPEVDREFGPLTDEAMHWKPAPDRWSVAECLQHLCLAGFTWADHLGPILFAALRRSVHHAEPHRPGPVGNLAIRMMEDDSRGHRAPSRFRPRDTSSLAGVDLLRAFTALGNSWEGTLLRASQLDISRLKVASPANALIVLPLGTWFYALSAHEDRHLGQARRVVALPEFPG